MAGGKPRSAFVLGVTGQDGALLAAELLRQGWRVYGGHRRGHTAKLWRLEELGILGRVDLINTNLHEPHQLIEAMAATKPDHVYHLAGESFVADSFQQPRSTIEANVQGTLNVLEAVRITAPDARLFFASSAEVFGHAETGALLDENSPLRPINPYGLSKLAAQHLAAIYRERYKLHAVCGIMFNHESPLRARNYVTRKITYNIARLRLAGGDPMQLGSLDASRDWGAASDYMRAAIQALELPAPRDYVFATGRKTSVREFLRLAAEAAGFTPAFDGEGLSIVCCDGKTGQKLAVVAEKYFRPFDTPPLVGNAARLRQAIQLPELKTVPGIVEEMVNADLQRRKSGVTHV